MTAFMIVRQDFVIQVELLHVTLFLLIYLLQCLDHRRDPMAAHFVHRRHHRFQTLFHRRDLLPLLIQHQRFHYSTSTSHRFNRWSLNFYRFSLHNFNGCLMASNTW